MSAEAAASGVRALGYVGVAATDLEAWRSFGTELLGLAAEAPGEASELRLRADERAYRILVERAERDGLGCLGLELADEKSLHRLAARLAAAGVATTEEPAALAARRSVRALVSCLDPSGHRVELFFGQAKSPAEFVSPTGARFVTGELGLGHAVLSVDHAQDALDFWVGLLGFRLSDTIQKGPLLLRFLRCNPRHHSLAFAEVEGGHGLRHVMLEVDSIDAVGGAYDRALREERKVVATLGRHSNDRVLSFYVRSPSGFAVEYGFGGRLVEEATWEVGHYSSTSEWGHAGL